MSKEFKGSRWTFVVNDEGNIQVPKRFYADLALLTTGYIGSLGIVYGVGSAIGVRPRNVFGKICTAVPMAGLADRLAVYAIRGLWPELKKDLDMYMEALTYSRKIKEAVEDGPKKADKPTSGHYAWDYEKDAKNYVEFRNELKKFEDALKEELDKAKKKSEEED